MNKKSKILSVFGFLSISAITVGSVSLSTTGLFQSNYRRQNYYFDNRLFSSYAELSNYVNDNLFDSNVQVENRNKWSIVKDGKIIYYSDPKNLRDSLKKDITNYKGKTSLSKINSDDQYGISASDLSKIYFNNPGKATIYRGRNNSIFENENSAKDSYLSIHDAYYFNGMYFRNKEDLTLYLDSIYYADSNSEGYQQKSSNKTIAILDSRDNYSAPIDMGNLYNQNIDLKESNNSRKEFTNFITSGTNAYVEIKTNSGYNYFSKDNISNIELKDAFLDPDYTKIYSNQGQGTYVVDLDSEDNNSLFGPYFTNSSKDILLMKDTKNWKKISKDDPLITKEQDSKQVANFLSLIIPQEIETEETKGTFPPINIKVLNEELKDYFNKLKSINSNLYSGYLNFLSTIQKGKNYNFFYSIILSYSWIINNLIQYRANESIIKGTKIMFNKISKLIDKNIYLLIPKKLLHSTKPGCESEIISFEKILGFSSNNKDFNTDIQYYIDEISYFSEFINAVNIINLANANSVSAAGIVPFNFNIANEYATKSRTYLNNKNALNKEHEYEYELIWNVFSATTSNEFYEAAKEINNKTRTIEQDKELADLSVDVSLSNVFYNAAYEEIYNTQRDELLKTKSISLLWDENSIFYGMSLAMFNSIMPGLSSLAFKDFMWIKMIDKLLVSINSAETDRKLQEIIKAPIVGKVALAKKTLLELMLKNELASKILFFGIPILNPAKILINGVLFLVAASPALWLASIYEHIRENVPDLIPVYNNISSIFSNFNTLISAMDDLSQLKNSLNSVATFAKTISKIGSAFTIAFAVVDIALAVLDIISGAFIPKTKYYSYVYETDDVKYIWNGGQKTTMFWGFKTLSETTIKDIKLLDPQPVTSAYNKDSYYYNGKMYDDLDELKYDELNDLLSGAYKSDDLSIKVVYSFDKLKTNSDIYQNRPENVFSEIGTIGNCKLTQIIDGTVINYMYNKIYQEIQSGKQISYKDIFTFANGHIANDVYQVKDILIDEVINNIKPVKIVQLPNIVDGKPNYDGNEENTYSLPFNSWTINSGVTYNLTNNKYIIYDPNVDAVSTARAISNDDIINNIKERFYGQFDVETKEVIKNEIKVAKNFTDLNNNIMDVNVYVAKPSTQNGTARVFLDESQALNYLLTEYDFTVYSTTDTVSTYKLPNNDLVFYSKDELIDWAIKNGVIKYE